MSMALFIWDNSRFKLSLTVSSRITYYVCYIKTNVEMSKTESFFLITWLQDNVLPYRSLFGDFEMHILSPRESSNTTGKF